MFFRAVFCCGYNMTFQLIHAIYSSIFFMRSSMALEQSYDCPNDSEVILKDMGKINRYQYSHHHHNNSDNKKPNRARI